MQLSQFDKRFFGGYSGEDPPVPISNTEVKLSSADGTAWVTVWESRTLPKFLKNPFNFGGVFFVLQEAFDCVIS